MFALDRNEFGMSQGAGAEPAPMILALPAAFERYGYPPERKRFVVAFLVTTLIHIAMLFAALNWHVSVTRRSPSPPLTVTLLPLSPPERSEAKPVQQQKAKPVPRKRPLPHPVEAPPPPSAPPVLVPVAPPLPAADVTTPMPSSSVMPVARSAPEAAPPSPPTKSAGKDGWEARVVARLDSLKRYPPAARSRRDQGVTTVRFRVNRQGVLLSSSLEGTSGSRLLDQEALATVKRAQPYPPIPSGRPDEIEVVVPIEFFFGLLRSGQRH